MGKVVYAPTEEGDAKFVEVYGVEFVAGRPETVDADVFAKLKGNPQFKVGKSADVSEDGEPAKIDGRSRAARQAKQVAPAGDAKARAAAHVADLQEADQEAKAEKAREAAEKAAAEALERSE